MGVFARIMTELAAQAQQTGMVMIDVEQLLRHRSGNRLRGHLKAHRTTASLGRKKGGAVSNRGG